MNKKIKQFRFPETLLEDNFFTEDGWSLNLIENLGLVTQLGIYALPGSRFKINQKYYIPCYYVKYIKAEGMKTINLNTVMQAILI